MRSWHWLILLSVLLGSPRGAAQQQALPSAPHVAVVVTGNVAFSRTGWTQSAPVRFGTALRADDLLTFGPGASAVIVCNGLEIKATVAGPGIKPVPCDTQALQNPNRWGKGTILPTARIDVPGFSLAPRTQTEPRDAVTLLRTFEEKPSFAWPAVDGADSYNITIHGPRRVWKMTTTAPTILSLSTPKLEPDETYGVSIVPMLRKKPLLDTDSGEASFLFNDAFLVLSRPSSSDITASVSALGKLGLPPTVVTFLTGRLLALSGSFDAAIESLQGLRGTLNEPALGRELGEVYRAKGSYADAERLLTDAAALYQKDGDIIGRALAEEAIAHIQLRSPATVASAVAHWQAALQTYQALGDTADVDRVQSMLKSVARLQTRQPPR